MGLWDDDHVAQRWEERMVSRGSLLGMVALALLAAAGCNTRPAPGVARGEYLYATCASCHGADGAGNQEQGAPAIAGLDQWYVEAQLTKFKAGHRGYHPDDTNGLRMRPMTLTLFDEAQGGDGKDLSSVAEYVSKMPAQTTVATLQGGDSSKGQALYAVCSSCHGVDGKGNQKVNAPPIGRLNDWYLLTQLQNFKAGRRGTQPADVTGLSMRAVTGTLSDEQAMKDVIAYIQTLPD